MKDTRYLPSPDVEHLLGCPVDAGWAYGSRVLGYARQNSDFDACFLFRGDAGKPPFHELQGIIEWFGVPINFEFKLYSRVALLERIEEGDAKLLFNLYHSENYQINPRLESHIKNTATTKLLQEIERMREAIKHGRLDKKLALMSLGFSQGLEILADKRLQHHPAAFHARLSEFLIDYFSWAQAYYLAYYPEEGTEEIWVNLFLLVHLASARLLDFQKFKQSASFAKLMEKINLSYANEDNVHTIFSLLHNHFKEIFGRDLLHKKPFVVRIGMHDA